MSRAVLHCGDVRDVLADPQRTDGLPLFADERHAAIEAGMRALTDTA